jgi:Flp pilus assembly protein TadG
MKTKRLAISLLKPGRGQSLRAGRLSGSGTGKRTLICRTRAFGRDESGAVAILTAILMVVLLGFLALAVDIGHLATVKNELQNAADAAALAGARALMPLTGTGNLPWPMSPPECTQATTWAQDTINRSDAQNLTITTVQTGVWDWATNTFTQNNACDATVNAVHVVVQRNSSSNQPVSTWFARIFGIDTVNSQAQATAAVGCLGTVPKGWLASNEKYLEAIKNYYKPFWDQYNNLYSGNPEAPDPNQYFKTNAHNFFSPLNGYEGEYCYFVFQPAKGSADWTLADNVAWSTPEGISNTPNVLRNLIQGADLSVSNEIGKDVNLTNGEIATLIKTVQNTLTSNPSVLENMIVTGVDTDSYNHPTEAKCFSSITITGAWKAGDSLPQQFLDNNPLIDPNQVVGLIQFYMLPDMVYGGGVGPCGGGTNTNSISPALVK